MGCPNYSSGTLAQNEFTITEHHLKLLKNMQVEWNQLDKGAPQINPYSPYGASQLSTSMAKILGLDAMCPCPNCAEIHNAEVIDRLSKFHREMEHVLQICISLQTFEAGIYVETPLPNLTRRIWAKKDVVR